MSGTFISKESFVDTGGATGPSGPTGPVPTLTSLAPNTAVVGAADTTVTLTGTNFVAPMTAIIDPPFTEAPISDVAVTVVSPTSATVVVPASALDAAGSTSVKAVTVNGTSNQLTISVA